MLGRLNDKWKRLLPFALLLAFALSRIPGMLPQNFSAAYALVFCAAVYFTGAMAWWLPLVTLLLTDIALNCYYASLGYPVWNLKTLGYLLFNYVAYAVIILLGRRYRPGSSFISLLGGGLLGALLFYLITNTASWFFNPFNNLEYTKTLLGWLRALTKGTDGWPQTWEFFRSTFLSTGLFTAFFVGAMKLTNAESPADKEAGHREPAGTTEDSEPAPEEAKA